MNDRPTARIARPHTTTATIARMSLGARAVHRKSALVGVVAACVVAAPVAAMTARVVGDSKRCDETTTTTREGKNARREGKNARRAGAMTDARRSGALSRALGEGISPRRLARARARTNAETTSDERTRSLSRSLSRVFDETNLNAFFPWRVSRLARARARRTRPFESTRPTDRPFESMRPTDRPFASMRPTDRPFESTRGDGIASATDRDARDRGRRRRRWTRSRLYASGVRAFARTRVRAGRDGDARIRDGGCWRRAR